MTRNVRPPVKGSRHTGKGSGSKYTVGYKRPPVATRFRSGGVGNPKGRPKKRKTVGQMFDEGFMARIRIEKNGQWKTMTALEHIIGNLIEAAARGDMRAVNTVFTVQHRYKDSPETTLNLAELDQQDREILEEYRAMPPANGADVVSSSSTTETNKNSDENKATDKEPTDKSSSNPNHSDGDE
jgi:Family of unknown function (DUF5681)